MKQSKQNKGVIELSDPLIPSEKEQKYFSLWATTHTILSTWKTGQRDEFSFTKSV